MINARQEEIEKKMKAFSVVMKKVCVELTILKISKPIKIKHASVKSLRVELPKFDGKNCMGQLPGAVRRNCSG